jgi:hypothetical protein
MKFDALKYDGVVYLFGSPASLAGMNPLRDAVRGCGDGKWTEYFKGLEEIKPIDGLTAYDNKRLRMRVNMMPVVGVTRNDRYILFCPTKAGVLNPEPGNIRARGKYLEGAERAVGIGHMGSYDPDALKGNVVFPEQAECSDKLRNNLRKQGFELYCETGYSDHDFREALMAACGKWDLNVRSVESAISLADVDEIRKQGLGKRRFKAGIYGSDMETQYFLRRCNIMSGREPEIEERESPGLMAASALVVADLPGERKFQRGAVHLPMSKRLEQPHYVSVSELVYAAPLAILEGSGDI